MNKLYLIGVGYRPFDERAKEIILNSHIILASSNRLFEIFKGYCEFERVKDKIKVINNVDETIEFIKSAIQNIVLLTSGDPMFHGIGRRAVCEFGKDMVEILPDLSSVQIAFSKIKETWDDALLISLHGSREKKYKMDDLPMLIQQHNKIAILTDKENNPQVIAKFLLKPSAFSLQPSALKMYVCEKLGYADERIIQGSPKDISVMDFLEPNVVIIQQSEDRGNECTEQSY